MLRFSRAGLLLVGTVTLLALVMAACGGGDEETGGTGTPATGTPKATATAAGTPKATATAAGTPKATAAATASATAQTTPTASATSQSTVVAPTATGVAATATPAPETFDNPDIGLPPGKIILGSHMPKSGTWGAAYAPVREGLVAYFNYVNAEQGGVCGRQIDFRAEDDQYDPTLAVSVIKKLVEQDHVFAIVGGLGSAAHSAVWEYLNEKGIPDLWVMAGEHKFNADPKGHPWTVPALPDYVVEGTLMGRYISENFPGQKVGILYQNDDFGHNVLEGLQNGLDPTKNELVSPQSYESTDISVRSQVANAKNAGAEVMVCGCIPPPAAQAIKGANAMNWRPQWLIDYVDTDPMMFSFASPQDMEGTLSMNGNKLIQWTDDPAVAKHIEIMKKYGDGTPPGGFSIEGQVAATLMVESLNRACNNLTRRGVMDAVESLRDFQGDLGLPGVTITVTPDDHMAVETMRFLRAKIVNGLGVWDYEGGLVSFAQ